MERGKEKKKQDRKRDGEKKRERKKKGEKKKKDFGQEKCCPCHFSVSLALLWDEEQMMSGDGIGGAGALPGWGYVCVEEAGWGREGTGGELGEQGTG